MKKLLILLLIPTAVQAYVPGLICMTWKGADGLTKVVCCDGKGLCL